MVPTAPARSDSVFLGTEGETQFELLRTALEIGTGFELFFTCSDSVYALNEVRARLERGRIPGVTFHPLQFGNTRELERILERLLDLGPTPDGRRAIFVGPTGLEDELRAAWARALVLLNEQRNRIVHARPDALLLAGPAWLPVLAHDLAPDLWSIRSLVVLFPDLPPGVRAGWATSSFPQRDSYVMAHELADGEYYASLADALKDNRRPPEQRVRANLLLKAGRALALRGEIDCAHNAFDLAKDIYDQLHDDHGKAIAMGQIADILQARGELDEALRILREEVLPAFERLGDVRALLVARANLAITLLKRGAPGDRKEARGLLHLALEAAKKLRLPEVAQIEVILASLGETD